MLKRMLAFSSDRFCWHTGTPVKESYLRERGEKLSLFIFAKHDSKQPTTNNEEYEIWG